MTSAESRRAEMLIGALLGPAENHGPATLATCQGLNENERARFADVLGVGHATVARDSKPVANATPAVADAQTPSHTESGAVANATPEPVDAMAALAADKQAVKQRERQAKAVAA